MIIIMRPGAEPDEISGVEAAAREAGLEPHVVYDEARRVIATVGDESSLDRGQFDSLPGVEKVVQVTAPYKLASSEAKEGRSVVRTTVPRRPDSVVDPTGRADSKAEVAAWGGTDIAVIAGPCTVEGREQIIETAEAVKAAGAVALRGGAFKPRTNPYSFQGLMEEGLEYLAEARERTGLPVVTEVLTPEDVALVAKYADVLQVGARNMQNYLLLRAVGEAARPVLLKRGMSATIDELLFAAEYVLTQGNPDVILCERGIRTFETHSRNTLSLSAVPALKRRSHLPVIADPSHGTGHAYLVRPMALAAVAAGADGLMVEVAREPSKALVDGAQALTFAEFALLMKDVGLVAGAVGRGPARTSH